MTFLGMMCGGYIWGTIADLTGRKHALIKALLFNFVFSTLCGVAYSLPWLLFFRLMSGVG
jgi:MFS family permease